MISQRPFEATISEVQHIVVFYRIIKPILAILKGDLPEKKSVSSIISRCHQQKNSLEARSEEMLVSPAPVRTASPVDGEVIPMVRNSQ